MRADARSGGHAERPRLSGPRRSDDWLRACRLSRGGGIRRAANRRAHFEVRTLEELERRAREADVLVVSGLWRNALITSAPKLRFVQSFSAGTDQFDKALFMKRGVRLASAQGANERAVAEHAIGLILALDASASSGARQPAGAALARHDRRSRAARAGTQRQDGGDRRPRPHWHAPRCVGARLRHACDWRAPHGETGARGR